MLLSEMCAPVRKVLEFDSARYEHTLYLVLVQSQETEEKQKVVAVCYGDLVVHTLNISIGLKDLERPSETLALAMNIA